MIAIKSVIDAKDILLILLYLPGASEQKNEPIAGRTRIMKIIYIFEKELLERFKNIDQLTIPEFFAYDYGPFSKDLLDDIRFFKAIGFLEETPINFELPDFETEERFYNTKEGIGCCDTTKYFLVDNSTEYKYMLSKKGMEYVEKNILFNFIEEQIKLLTNFKKKFNSMALNDILIYVYNKYPESAKVSKIRNKFINY